MTTVFCCQKIQHIKNIKKEKKGKIICKKYQKQRQLIQSKN